MEKASGSLEGKGEDDDMLDCREIFVESKGDSPFRCVTHVAPCNLGHVTHFGSYIIGAIS